MFQHSDPHSNGINMKGTFIYLTSSFIVSYFNSGDMNSGQVWCSSGEHQLSCQIFKFSNAISQPICLVLNGKFAKGKKKLPELGKFFLKLVKIYKCIHLFINICKNVGPFEFQTPKCLIFRSSVCFDFLEISVAIIKSKLFIFV